MKTLRSVCKNEEAILVNLGIVPSCGPIIKNEHLQRFVSHSTMLIEQFLVSLRGVVQMQCMQIRVGVMYSTCTWYLYLSTYLSVLVVLEYLVYGNVKVLVLDQKVLGTYK